MLVPGQRRSLVGALGGIVWGMLEFLVCRMYVLLDQTQPYWANGAECNCSILILHSWPCV